MSKLSIENLNFYYGDFQALKDINLEIRDRQITALIGPSGCGKSTALRCLAGLEDISDGQILIDEQVVNDVPPKDRDIAMVFQSYALYPHMSVFDNMAFGLKPAWKRCATAISASCSSPSVTRPIRYPCRARASCRLENILSYHGPAGAIHVQGVIHSGKATRDTKPNPGHAGSRQAR